MYVASSGQNAKSGKKWYYTEEVAPPEHKVR
jgi:hypothetical protein